MPATGRHFEPIQLVEWGRGGISLSGLSRVGGATRGTNVQKQFAYFRDARLRLSLRSKVLRHVLAITAQLPSDARSIDQTPTVQPMSAVTLRPASEFVAYTIGRVSDLYFDDRAWTLRYPTP